LASPEPSPALDKPIGLVHATAMVVGIIIGASIFVQPSEINRHVPSAAGVLSVWAVAGIITLFGALVCAELSSAMPRTGGVYVFLKETVSPAWGFLWGWAMFWSAHSGIIAASSVILARYVGFFVPLGDWGTRAVAVAAILLLSFVNYLGVRQGSRLQTAITVTKIAIVAGLLVMVAVFGKPASVQGIRNGQAALHDSGFDDFVLGVSAALFAFGGWHMVTYTAGETRDARRTIPRALVIGSLAVTGSYVALNAAYLYLLPLDRVVSSTRVAADAAQAMAGTRAAATISALVILSSSGVLNGVILAGPRTYFAMAEEGLAFRWLAGVHPRYHTPHRAILLQAAWSCALVATGTYRELFTRVIYTEWLFFALMAAGLMRLRRRPDYRPVYAVWGYPAVPLVFIAAAVTVSAIQIAADPVKAGTGLAIVVLGLPVYRFGVRKHDH